MRRATTIFAACVMALWLLPTLAAASAPAIEYSTPDPIDNKSAALRFSIDPEGLETSYEIEIAKVGKSLISNGMPGVTLSGNDPVALEVKVPRYFETNLSPGTEYHWRVTASNDDGKTVGAEQLFTTTSGPTPVFTSGTASQTGPNSVSFTGTVDPEGESLTGCSFRWVDKTTFINAGFEKHGSVGVVRFGDTVPCSESLGEIGSGTEPVSVSGEASGLEPGEYVFRVEGENAFGGFAAGAAVPFTVDTPASSLQLSASSFTPAIRPKRCSRVRSKNAARSRTDGKKRGHTKKARRRACSHR